MTSDLTQGKIEGLVKRVLSTPADNFADRYFQVSSFVRGLSPEERTTLVTTVDKMYETDPYAALGFTLYGELNELEQRVKQQLSSDSESRVVLALECARDLKIDSLYGPIVNKYRQREGNNIKKNLLVLMMRLRPKESWKEFYETMGKANTSDQIFLLSNILYDLSRDNNTLEELGLLKEVIPNWEEIYARSLKRAKEMVESSSN